MPTVNPKQILMWDAGAKRFLPSSDYLPASGGTITGVLTIDTPAQQDLKIIIRNSRSDAWGNALMLQCSGIAGAPRFEWQIIPSGVALESIFRLNYLDNAFAIGDIITFKGSHKIGMRTGNPTVSGNGILHMQANTFRLAENRSPASGSAGNLGEICADDDFIYRYTNAGWRRAQLFAY